MTRRLKRRVIGVVIAVILGFFMAIFVAGLFDYQISFYEPKDMEREWWGNLLKEKGVE